MRGLELRLRFIVGGLLTLAGCAVAIAWMLVMPVPPNALEGMLVVDPLTQLVKIALLALTAFTVLISIESDFTHHVGEYLALILMATAGMMFLVSAGDLLMLFVALEMTSLSLYILTAFNKRNIRSAEAALKYFLVGGLSAAFLLFGLSWIYGMAGTTDFHKLAAALAAPALDPLLIVALVLAVIGFGFKVAAVPFHLWAPDAYQGAPTPSAAFIASGSKVASFFIFAKLMMLGCRSAGRQRGLASGRPVVPVVAVVAAFSMLLGNLVAIVQATSNDCSPIRPLPMQVTCCSRFWPTIREAAASLYYAATYGLTTIGALRRGRRGGAGGRRFPVERLCRTLPPRAGGGLVHDGVHVVARGHSATGRFLWEVLSVHRSAQDRGAESRSALAGDSGRRHECGVALLLFAGAQANLRRRRAGGRRRMAGVGLQPDRARIAGCGRDPVGSGAGLAAVTFAPSLECGLIELPPKVGRFSRFPVWGRVRKVGRDQ